MIGCPLCLDHTKFNRHSIAPLCSLDEVDAIVTDSAAPAEMVEAVRQTGVEVITAE